MFSYRTLAGVGAAALVFLALSRVSKHCRHRSCDSAEEIIKKATGRVQGVIRRRHGVSNETENDVI